MHAVTSTSVLSMAVLLGGLAIPLAMRTCSSEAAPTPVVDYEAYEDDSVDPPVPERPFVRTTTVIDVMPMLDTIPGDLARPRLLDIPRMAPLEPVASSGGRTFGLREGAVTFVDPEPTDEEREVLAAGGAVFRAVVPTYVSERWISAYIVEETHPVDSRQRIDRLHCATFDRHTGAQIWMGRGRHTAVDEVRMTPDGNVECVMLDRPDGTIGERPLN